MKYSLAVRNGHGIRHVTNMPMRICYNNLLKLNFTFAVRNVHGKRHDIRQKFQYLYNEVNLFHRISKSLQMIIKS